MKRRSFLKGLLGLIVVPIAAKVGIEAVQAQSPKGEIHSIKGDNCIGFDNLDDVDRFFRESRKYFYKFYTQEDRKRNRSVHRALSGEWPKLSER